MHRVVVDEPYRFVPPYRKRWFSWLFRIWLRPFLRRRYGLVQFHYHGLEHVRSSLASGHGILLCPNHSRDADPMLIGMLCRKVPCHVFSLASWHLFRQSRLEAIVIRLLGGFSIFREGLDREALNAAVEIVATAERPLVIFPEGVISRSNDRLLGLMDGVSFIARTAARRRAALDPAGQVVIHPVAIRYTLTGDIQQSVGPVLSRLEQRTFWKTNEHLPVLQRIRLLARALLASREVEVLGDSQSGPLRPRIQRLMDAVLHPCEVRWLGGPKQGDPVGRVKDLRTTILAELLQKKLSSAEVAERWRALTDCYYVQTLSLYPEHYLDDDQAHGKVTPERLAETVHRLEEDLTDRITLRPEWKVEFRIGPAIPVEVSRRSRGTDPLMQQLRTDMLQLLGVEDWWPPEPQSAAPQCMETHTGITPQSNPPE
ncbi:MAG: lysophospholipid acyltransferase family protein [Planctomycetaceae bacterium]